MADRVLGVGLGYRAELHQEILDSAGDLDFLEVISDQFVSALPDRLERLRQVGSVYPLVSHSLAMSVGTAQPVDPDYLARTADFVQGIDPHWFSDHLCMTKVEETDLHSLTPLWFTEEVVDTVVANVRRIRETVPGRPFLLENISYYLAFPQSTMTEPQFLTRVLEQADCGLLLDVNNVFVNSRNLDFDPYQFLRSIPLERVVQVHIAGFKETADLLIDTHDSPVDGEVWQLLDYVCRHSPVLGVSLERDANLPEFSEIRAELAHARRVMRQAGRCS